MARCTRLIVSCLLITVSLRAFFALEPDQDPTLDVIRSEDQDEVDPVYNRESLKCSDPKADSNVVTVISGDPYHLYTKVHVQCNEGLTFSNGLSSVNASCFPAPHPCMCIAIWETSVNVMYDFNCTEEFRCPTVQTEDNHVTAVSGDLYHLSSVLNIRCDPGTQLVNGLTSANATCMPTPHPCMCIGYWSVPDNGMLRDFHCTESFRCPTVQTEDNTVTAVSGALYHLSSVINIRCAPGTQLSIGLASVNASCRPYPHPCMCLGYWTTEAHGDLDDYHCREYQNPGAQQTTGDRYNVIGVKLKDELKPQTLEANDKTEINFGTQRRDIGEILSQRGVEIGKETEEKEQTEKDENTGLETHESADTEHSRVITDNHISDETEVENIDSQSEEDNEEQNSQSEPSLEAIEEEISTDAQEQINKAAEEEVEHEEPEYVEPEETEYVEPEEPKYVEHEESEYVEHEEPEYVEPEEEEETETEEHNGPETLEHEEEQPEHQVYNVYEPADEEETEIPESETEDIDNGTHEEIEIQPTFEELERRYEVETDADREYEEDEQLRETLESPRDETLSEDLENIDEKEEEEEEEEEENRSEVEILPHDSNYVEEDEEFEPEEDVEDPNYANNYLLDERVMGENMNTVPFEEYEEMTNEIGQQPDIKDFEVPRIFKYNRQQLEQINGPSILLDALLEPLDEFDGEREEEPEDIETDIRVDDTDVEVPGWFQDVQMEPVEESQHIVPPAEFGNLCSFPPETGPCKMVHLRYYYDSKTKECHQFVYGGCNGNSNNFAALRDCIAACVTNDRS